MGVELELALAEEGEESSVGLSPEYKLAYHP